MNENYFFVIHNLNTENKATYFGKECLVTAPHILFMHIQRS